MATLCMAAILAFAPVAAAQSASASASATTDDLNCGDLSEAEEQAVFEADLSDPNNLDDDDDGLPCEDDTTDNGSYPAATGGGEETTMMEEPPVAPTSGQYDENEGQYDDGDATPNTVSPETETVVLPETGGPSPAAFALPSLALLVAGGIFAARLVRK